MGSSSLKEIPGKNHTRRIFTSTRKGGGGGVMGGHAELPAQKKKGRNLFRKAAARQVKVRDEYQGGEAWAEKRRRNTVKRTRKGRINENNTTKEKGYEKRDSWNRTISKEEGERTLTASSTWYPGKERE